MIAKPDQFARRVRGLRSPLETALVYADAGWAVLPLAGVNGDRCTCGRACASPAKHPLTRHGVCDARVEPAQIRRWWLRWPSANVGVATGARSGLTVVDVDVKGGGRASLATLHAAGLVLPPTLKAFTGGGGFHLFYRQPENLAVQNCVGRLPNVAGPVPGVDLRGDGGYVVAPPSVHVSGFSYRWSTRQPSDMAMLPRWMWPRPPPPPSAEVRLRPCPTGASPYGLAALQREIEAVRRLVVGERNHGLNRTAFSLGRLVAGGELAGDEVHRELLAAALAVGLTDGEARATIRSGMGAGARSPRRAPHKAASFGAAGANGHVARS
jgi:hypothetical protein